MDIIVNHTADVIQYRECGTGVRVSQLAPIIRTAAQRRRRRRGDQPGFAGDDIADAENFAKLTDPNYAYTPYRPDGRAER